MTRRLSLLLVTALAAVSFPLALMPQTPTPPVVNAAPAAVESFELVQGQLVFSTAGQRSTARTRITQLLNKRTFRDVDPTLIDVPAGKYGAGPTLVVTLQMADRADADAIWSRVDTESLQFLLNGSQILQSSVSFDAVTGEQTVTLVHQRSFPPQPTDT